MQRLFYLLVFVLLSNVGIAQQQANNWMFGDSLGLDFNSGAPVPVYTSVINQREGCSTISDSAGRLLFYTDGISVWNKNHQVMPNGTGLLGDISSSQSALIVQQPGSTALYYIFTTEELGLSDGLNYSIVDMRLDGGKGDVTAVKNNMLLAATTEKLTAVKHANGRDIWVIAHQWDSDAFNCYLLTGSGLVVVPVVSHTGFVHSINDVGNATGCMKTSPDGNYLALTIAGGPDLRVEIFDFDNTSGSISKIVTDSAIRRYSEPYGIEFSRQSRYLYATVAVYDSIGGYLFQYDLMGAAPAAILASKTLIAVDTGFFMGLQLAVDGKIYISTYDQPMLHSINYPDSAGSACGFQLNAVNFTCAECSTMIGLPNFMTSYFNTDTATCTAAIPVITSNANIICTSDSAQICAPAGMNSYLWNNGLNTQCITARQAGNYYVTITDGNNCSAVSGRFVLNTYPQPPISITVAGDTLKAYNADAYQWYLNDEPIQSANSAIYIVTVAGSYTVQVTDANGCKAVSSAVIITGLAENENDQISIGPNPSTGHINITAAVPLKTIAAYNALGQMVYFNKQLNAREINIDLSDMPPGVYYVHAQTTAGVFKGKVVVGR